MLEIIAAGWIGYRAYKVGRITIDIIILGVIGLVVTFIFGFLLAWMISSMATNLREERLILSFFFYAILIAGIVGSGFLIKANPMTEKDMEEFDETFRQSVNECMTLLHNKGCKVNGYKIRENPIYWVVKEPLGGKVTLHSITELQDYTFANNDARASTQSDS